MQSEYKLFAKIIEAGSLSAAGRVLHLSPAMVSKTLARLEERLGVRLVHRTTRRLALTERGEIFYRDVVAILANIKDAETRASGSPGVPSGPLRISAPSSFGRLHVAPIVGDFLQMFPQVQLEIFLSDSFEDLLNQRIDVAIRVATRIDPSLQAHRLAPSRRILCASPAYIQSHGLPASIEELGRHRLLAASGQLPWHVVSRQGEHLIEGTSFVATNSSEIVRELALAGVGIAFRSVWDVGAAISSGALTHVLPGFEGPADRAIYAAHPRAPTIPLAAQEFINFLKSIFSKASLPHLKDPSAS